MKKHLYLLFLLACYFPVTYSQSFNQILAAKLQTKLDSIRAAQNLKGVSATVYKPGEGYWIGVSGESYAGIPISPDMLFGIASNSKLFTAACILKLQENNLLDVDDSLHQWLPTYPNIDTNITIRQLLNHTSGLRDLNEYPGYPQLILGDPTHIFTNEERIQLVGPPLFAAGTDWSYSNTNYILAGMIVESVTGRPYVEFLRDSILTPLDLDSTYLDVYEPLTGTIAHPWNGGVDIVGMPRVSLNSAAWSAGGMYSTSGEMAQWYKALFLDHFLSDASFQEMTTFVGSGNYGMGIGKLTVNGDTVWAHGGDIRGYRSTNFFDPETHIIVNVYINQNPASPIGLAAALFFTAKNTTTGTADYETDPDVVIYPNPTTDNIYIRATGTVTTGVTLYNMLGQPCLNSRETTISISALTGGQYMVRVVTEKGVVNRMVMKQ